MKKLVLLAIISFVNGVAFTQLMPTRGQAPAGRFYGKVVNSLNKGIDAASVTLVTNQLDSVTKKQKEVIVGGMLTSGTGDFSIENVPLFGKYKLRITGIGYKPLEMPASFEMPGRNTGGNNPVAMLGALDKDLGNLKLEIDENILVGVTVTASKPILQMGIDRKVFNVDKNITSAGGTAVDVMKNVPSVNVDIDGNVTLRNNAPQIFVDGRPTNLSLDQIPSDAIESVEIITNPSAKFDASGGTAGILNIVLKKNKRVGYSGNLRANIDSRGRIGGGGDINIRQNKINFFATGFYNQRKSISTGITSRSSYGFFDSSFSLQNDKTIMDGAMKMARGGFDYFIDNRNTITVNGTFFSGKFPSFSNTGIYVDSLSKNVRFNQEYQQRITNAQRFFKRTGTQLSYKHNFPKAGHELTADATFNQGKNSNNNTIQADYFKMPGKTFARNYQQTQTGSGTNKNFVLQTDYTNPLGANSKLEAGARASMNKINSQTDYFISGKQTTTIYNSTDNVYAAYINFSNRIKNFGYQAGLRAESSNYNGIVPNKGQTFNIRFPISFFPSIFLTQKISDKDEIQINYSRRINRPNFFQLFPFTDYSDSLNISRGNPNLKPEFTNSFELSYSKTFKNNDNFIASLYFKNTKDLITRYQALEFDTLLNKNSIVSSYINANKSYITGLELTGKNKITKWWDLITSTNFFTSKINLTNQPSPPQFLSYFIKINNMFKLPKNFSVQLSGDYQSKIISSPVGGNRMYGGFGDNNSTAQGFIRPNYGIDAAIRFEFLKEKKASVSLNVNDIFRTKVYNAHAESPYFSQDIFRRRDPQVFRLNFNWRFGKFDANLFKRKNTKAENTIMDNTNF